MTDADERLTGISASNLQRETTFNERFIEVRTDINNIRVELQKVNERCHGRIR